MSGVYLAWVGLYFVSILFIPSRKLCRGLFTRHILIRFIPPRRFWAGPWRNSYRYMLWVVGSLPLLFSGVVNSANARYAVFFGVYILLLLDDYIFGDDENRKKMREWARNKIKWKMKLPAPVTDQVAS